MRRRFHRLIPSAVLLAGLLSASGTLAEAMEVQRQGDVRYITGGVSNKEQQQLRAKAADYDLQLTLAREDTGAYLAGVTVTITDAQGREVLKTEALGPLLLADLPNGDYRIRAEADGWEQATRRLHLGDEPRAIYLTLRSSERG